MIDANMHQIVRVLVFHNSVAGNLFSESQELACSVQFFLRYQVLYILASASKYDGTYAYIEPVGF